MNPFDSQRSAREEMLREGFQPDFTPDVLAEVKSFGVATESDGVCRDLRDSPWSSIDNPESRDLDQIEWAESLPGDRIRVLVAVADVDAVVPPKIERPPGMRASTPLRFIRAGRFSPCSLSGSRRI